MGTFWFITGGARSGKSSFAEKLAISWGNEVVFLATAEGIDDDMMTRIARHQQSRPSEWTTVEEPVDIVSAGSRSPQSSTLVIDCLTVWVGNLFHRRVAQPDIEVLARDLRTFVANRAGRTIVVSNDVGLGVHPETELGRKYRDCLGRVNSIVASESEHCVFMSAGKAMMLQDVEYLL
jgi:adenosyl cobinamide kinase/adenosyl cobinamide phosphate guanylyltransferase